MTERRVLLVATDPAEAGLLLTTLPPDMRTSVVLLGVEPDDLPADTRRLPIDRLIVAPQLSPTSPADVAGPLLEELALDSDIVMLGSAQSQRDLAGRLCVTLDRPVIWAIDAVRNVDGGIEADRIVAGGSHQLVHTVTPPVIVLAKPAASSSPLPNAGADPQVSQLAAQPSQPRTRIVGTSCSGHYRPSLAAARIVVSIGRGIGGPDRVDTYRQLTNRLGVALGASRVAVDSGWISFAHQVGQTGSTVAPDVYVAFGISGAIQHLAGMRTSRQIVAVNTDPEAPMCRAADLVIHADANEVADGLLKRTESLDA